MCTPTSLNIFNLLFSMIFLGGVSTRVTVRNLGRLHVDPASFTISGFSSGAAQAMQFHFCYSSLVKGVGIFSGVPYLYGLGRTREDFYVNDPDNMNLTKTIDHINAYAASGKIDSTQTLPASNIFAYHGSRDTIVNPGSATKIQQIYEHYGAHVNYNILDGQHGMPTDNFGGPCGTLNLIQNLVNNCKYSGVYEMFNYLYGGHLKKPEKGAVGSIPLHGDFFEFDQSQFFEDYSEPHLASLDPNGYAYIPSGCKNPNSTCKLSFALHGCTQSRYRYADKFARTTGYLEVAELNDIVLVFPQAKPSSFNPKNPHGCWDWWGFTGEGYGTKDGLQVKALKRMLDSVLIS